MHPRTPSSLPRHAFLTAEWRYLVMLNYEVDERSVAPLVPAGTVLDRWDGRVLVSVVGFRFLDTCVLRVPVPGHRDFDEVNLRFYVRRELPGGETRRAVVFVREFVPRPAIAALARLAYNEPYTAVPMQSVTPSTLIATPGRLEYSWRTGDRWHRVGATTHGLPALAAEHSEATFITEHYWGYTRQRDGGTVEYQVAHPRWRPGTRPLPSSMPTSAPCTARPLWSRSPVHPALPSSRKDRASPSIARGACRSRNSRPPPPLSA